MIRLVSSEERFCSVRSFLVWLTSLWAVSSQISVSAAAYSIRSSGMPLRSFGIGTSLSANTNISADSSLASLSGITVVSQHRDTVGRHWNVAHSSGNHLHAQRANGTCSGSGRHRGAHSSVVYVSPPVLEVSGGEHPSGFSINPLHKPRIYHPAEVRRSSQHRLENQMDCSGGF